MNEKHARRAQFALFPLLLGSVATEALAILFCLELGTIYPETAGFAPYFAGATAVVFTLLQAALAVLFHVLHLAATDRFFTAATRRAFGRIRLLVAGAAAVLATGGAYLLFVAKLGGPGVILASIAVVTVAIAFDQLAKVAGAALDEARQYRDELAEVI
ncbi:MAG: DUF2975 domain-containing protein [Buchananella hordeovulneris]|nr:DUF2975 domain-containing protein [Buchananella hordeovulneris]